jgi:hypothetical protein
MRLRFENQLAVSANFRQRFANDQLREIFVRWYPAMQTEQETEIEKKAA